MAGRIKAVFQSNAGSAVVEEARKERAQLVVVGARERNSAERVVLGSVSQHVLHHCHCPVAVAHRPQRSHTKDTILMYM